MKKLLLTLAVAAFALATGAQARLTWTLEQCQNHWGAPFVQYNAQVDSTCYNFRVSSQLVAQVYLLEGRVHSITYASRNARFLANNVPQLLQKNCSGLWQIYDDHRGKETLASWHIDDGNTPVAYALLWNYPDANGFYKLQVSTMVWGAYLQDHGIDRIEPNNDSNGLNNVSDPDPAITYQHLNPDGTVPEFSTL
jgi:hypothetical protein